MVPSDESLTSSPYTTWRRAFRCWELASAGKIKKTVGTHRDLISLADR
jgi:hypothetical protein